MSMSDEYLRIVINGEAISAAVRLATESLESRCVELPVERAVALALGCLGDEMRNAEVGININQSIQRRIEAAGLEASEGQAK